MMVDPDASDVRAVLACRSARHVATAEGIETVELATTLGPGCSSGKAIISAIR